MSQRAKNYEDSVAGARKGQAPALDILPKVVN